MKHMKRLLYDDDLVRTMVDWHLKQSAHWLSDRLDRAPLGERDMLIFEFKADFTAETA